MCGCHLHNYFSGCVDFRLTCAVWIDLFVQPLSAQTNSCYTLHIYVYFFPTYARYIKLSRYTNTAYTYTELLRTYCSIHNILRIRGLHINRALVYTSIWVSGAIRLMGISPWNRVSRSWCHRSKREPINPNMQWTIANSLLVKLLLSNKLIFYLAYTFTNTFVGHAFNS